MKLEKIVTWLDQTLNVSAFNDVSNNGVQIGMRDEGRVKRVAVAVDASVRAVEAAVAAGAQLLVVHHGISWGGGIRHLTGGVYTVVKAAMEANLALYACHLPLDAHPTLGNNAQLAKLLGLKKTRPAFNYHGHLIGLIGQYSARQLPRTTDKTILSIRSSLIPHSPSLIGLCSGGAGEFAEEAKRLGCQAYLTGEASWGDVIAAENCGIKMICAGHYETEVFGVRALASFMKKSLGIKTIDLT